MRFQSTLPLYFSSGGAYLVLCLFCPNGNHEKLEYDFTTSLQNIRNSAHRVLNTGYGRPAYLLIPLLSAEGVESVTPCFCMFTNYKLCREIFLQSVKQCQSKLALGLSTLQSLLNVTFFTNNHMDGDNEPNIDQNWFLRVSFGLRLYEHPFGLNGYVQVRGYEIYVSKRDTVKGFEYMITCVNIKDMYNFDLPIFSVITFPVWMCIIIVLLAFSFVSRNIFIGMEALWPLIGITPSNWWWTKKYSGRKKMIAAYLISATIFYAIYSAFISADTMRLRGLESLSHLVANHGYKFWIYANAALVRVALTKIPHAFRNLDIKNNLHNRDNWYFLKQ